jgi:hypothetical protein
MIMMKSKIVVICTFLYYQPQMVIWHDPKVDNIMSQKDLLKN